MEERPLRLSLSLDFDDPDRGAVERSLPLALFAAPRLLSPACLPLEFLLGISTSFDGSQCDLRVGMEHPAHCVKGAANARAFIGTFLRRHALALNDSRLGFANVQLLCRRIIDFKTMRSLIAAAPTYADERSPRALERLAECTVELERLQPSA